MIVPLGSEWHEAAALLAADGHLYWRLLADGSVGCTVPCENIADLLAACTPTLDDVQQAPWLMARRLALIAAGVVPLA